MTTKAKPAKAGTQNENLYDGGASQRIAFEMTEGSEKFETAHHVGPLTDQKYLEFVDTVNGDAEDLTAAYEEAAHQLWRDLIVKVENADAGGEDFRDLIDRSEAVAVITGILSVIAVKPQDATGGIRKLNGTVTVKTHAFQNGQLLQQVHEMRRRSDELRKQYDVALQADSNSQRAKAKAAIYDSMLVKSTGFKGKTPVRFKTTVVDDLFGRTQIDPKK